MYVWWKGLHSWKAVLEGKAGVMAREVELRVTLVVSVRPFRYSCTLHQVNETPVGGRKDGMLE